MDGLVFTGWRENERGGLFGNWETNILFPSGQRGGSWSIQPIEDNSEQAQKLKAIQHSSMLEELMLMGFEERACHLALDRCSDLTSAVDFLTSQGTISKERIDEGETSVAQSQSALVQQIIEMGFSAEQAALALNQTNNNINQAIEWLFLQ